jgi:hypothetical protein
MMMVKVIDVKVDVDLEETFKFWSLSVQSLLKEIYTNNNFHQGGKGAKTICFNVFYLLVEVVNVVDVIVVDFSCWGLGFLTLAVLN